MDTGAAPVIGPVLDFLEKVFTKETQRRRIMMYWHASKGTNTAKGGVRLSDRFEEFINSILYGKTQLHLRKDNFILFGSDLPVSYQWLDRSERERLIQLVARRESLFKTRKEYENNQFDYSDPTTESGGDQVPLHWRRQLVRDFIWMVCAKKQIASIQELIVALQHISMRYPQDVFISTLHWSMQGKCYISEVLCWDLTPSDLHPEVAAAAAALAAAATSSSKLHQ